MAAGSTDAAPCICAPSASVAGSTPASAVRLADFRKSRRSIHGSGGSANGHAKRSPLEIARASLWLRNRKPCLRHRPRLAVIPGAENHVPEAGGHAEVGVRVVVMDVVETGPA